MQRPVVLHVHQLVDSHRKCFTFDPDFVPLAADELARPGSVGAFPVGINCGCYSLGIPSRRDAKFTLSPITVEERRRSEPILPTLTSPVFKPIPIPIGGRPARCNFWFSWARRLTICSAQEQLKKAWSSCGTGDPQKAMIASPMNLSSVPFVAKRISVICP